MLLKGQNKIEKFTEEVFLLVSEKEQKKKKKREKVSWG